jgi:hypothetical protein
VPAAPWLDFIPAVAQAAANTPRATSHILNSLDFRKDCLSDRTGPQGSPVQSNLPPLHCLIIHAQWTALLSLISRIPRAFPGKLAVGGGAEGRAAARVRQPPQAPAPAEMSARWWNGYYTANVVIVASYALLRSHFAWPSDPAAPDRRARINSPEELHQWVGRLVATTQSARGRVVWVQ